MGQASRISGVTPLRPSPFCWCG
ncbi:hypothetical protein ACLB1N_24585 [Escherichia coli]